MVHIYLYKIECVVKIKIPNPDMNRIIPIKIQTNSSIFISIPMAITFSIICHRNIAPNSTNPKAESRSNPWISFICGRYYYATVKVHLMVFAQFKQVKFGFSSYLRICNCPKRHR